MSMNIDSARLIYFSPTGTTRNILEGIAEGAMVGKVEHVDLTPPDARTGSPAAMHDGLAIIGAPVYIGRVSPDAASRLRRIRGGGAPAVIVVVYGNRAYEDALLELRDLALEAGFKPVAAAAFIGEHSFSSSATPIAAGRPDADDLRKARQFGKAVRHKMRNIQALDDMSPLRVPGGFPYKERRTLSEVSPVTLEAACVKCGLCVSACPTAAIALKDTVVTCLSACIKCCACVKTCSTGARMMEDAYIRQVAEQLSTNCRERKEPETYM